MRSAGIGLGGRSLADHGLAADQARLVIDRLRFFQRGIDGRGIMPVDVRHDMPAVGFEALRRIVGKPARNLAVDGNAVVVVKRDQLAEAPGARQ